MSNEEGKRTCIGGVVEEGRRREEGEGRKEREEGGKRKNIKGESGGKTGYYKDTSDSIFVGSFRHLMAESTGVEGSNHVFILASLTMAGIRL